MVHFEFGFFYPQTSLSPRQERLQLGPAAANSERLASAQTVATAPNRPMSSKARRAKCRWIAHKTGWKNPQWAVERTKGFHQTCNLLPTSFRPTTIEGWTIRGLQWGTAVLVGPNGVWTRYRGARYLGVGKID